jgi:hypothetical protein
MFCDEYIKLFFIPAIRFRLSAAINNCVPSLQLAQSFHFFFNNSGTYQENDEIVDIIPACVLPHPARFKLCSLRLFLQAIGLKRYTKNIQKEALTC